VSVHDSLLLASIGIYGLLAYMVGQRSREIGLRLALGAQRADVLRLVMGKGVVLAGLGIVAGVIFSASTASMMASLLYGVRPHDPAVFLAAPFLLLIVALLASYIPAWRATKVDPPLPRFWKYERTGHSFFPRSRIESSLFFVRTT
jgi:ABC-type antimicrobial peptide transport system permease subunit